MSSKTDIYLITMGTAGSIANVPQLPTGSGISFFVLAAWNTAGGTWDTFGAVWGAGLMPPSMNKTAEFIQKVMASPVGGNMGVHPEVLDLCAPNMFTLTDDFVNNGEVIQDVTATPSDFAIVAVKYN